MNRLPSRLTIPGAAFLLAAALLMPLCPPASAEDDPPPPDTLRPGDALFVRIDRLGGHLPAYREIVDSDGDIELPFLGMMSAAGKSIPSLEADMAAAYAAARLASNAAVRIRFITHFDPAPDRASLVRSESPRIPVPAPDAFLPPSGPSLNIED
ncbi:MAG TPA: polysaccharide biosynthesis/export family protein [Kiritimatiellia bacterium]|nr:polysaccharide biosynthesis/export family protein [Kiritimatiellia bacterium]